MEKRSLEKNPEATIHWTRLIGHFRDPLCLCFKASLNAKPVLWKWLWFAWKLASSRPSVSQGAAQKTAREKINKHGEFYRFLSPRFFFIFSRAVFCAAPWLTERLEEATWKWTHFHVKGFALRLVLKQRLKRTRKWHIVHYKAIFFFFWGGGRFCRRHSLFFDTPSVKRNVNS